MTAQTGRDELTAALDPKLEIHAAVARIVREQLPDAAAVTVAVERPRDASHGDYATNVALVLAKAARRNPRELATAIGASLETALADLIDKPQVAGPGFLNVTLKEPARQRGRAHRWRSLWQVRHARRRARRRRVRVGESDRPAARRPWPASGARRR